jgi:hypothetical protein
LAVTRKGFWDRWDAPNPFTRFNSWALPWKPRRHIGMWWAIGTSREQLSKIMLGDMGRWTKEPPRQQHRNGPMKHEHKAFLDHLKEYLGRGIIVPIPKEHAATILKIKVEEGKKLRPIIDGSPLRFHAPNISFRCHNIYDVLAYVSPDATQLTWDFMHAFHQCAMSPQLSRHFVFEWRHPVTKQKMLFAYLGYVFGDKLNPLRYNKRVGVIVTFLARMGMDITSFYDDNDVFVPSHKVAIGACGNFIAKVLNGLGWVVRPAKTDVHKGSTIREYIGFVIKTETNTLTVTEKKIE